MGFGLSDYADLKQGGKCNQWPLYALCYGRFMLYVTSRMMIAIKRRRADFLLLFVLIWPIVKWQKWRETPPESRSPHNLAASPYKSDQENRKNRQSVHMFSQKKRVRFFGRR
jgi:hypothetical protein